MGRPRHLLAILQSDSSLKSSGRTCRCTKGWKRSLNPGGPRSHLLRTTHTWSHHFWPCPEQYTLGHITSGLALLRHEFRQDSCREGAVLSRRVGPASEGREPPPKPTGCRWTLSLSVQTHRPGCLWDQEGAECFRLVNAVDQKFVKASVFHMPTPPPRPLSH